MKKILLSLFLVLCLMLSVFAVACDNNDKDDEKNNNNKKEQATDNVEANIAKLVSTINKGINIDELMNEVNSNTEVQAEVDKALNQLKTFAYQASVVATNVDGENAEVYVGMKDGSIYANAAGDVAYAFIEDDFKIVTVSQDYEGNWEGEVMDEYAEMIEMLKNPASLGEVTESEEFTMVKDFINGLELPKIEKSNIKYDNGKYVFDNAYLESVVYAALEAAWDFSVEQDPSLAETPEQFDEAKAMVEEYIGKVEYSLYCYMKNEQLTGIGASVKMSSDLAAEMGMKTAEFAFDLSTEVVGFTANFVEADGTVVMKGNMKMNNTFDANGALKATTFNMEISAPYSDYMYEEIYNEDWDEYYHDEVCRVEGLATVKAAFMFDFSKIENGEFMTLNGSFTRKAETASVWVENDYSSEYQYSAEYTNKYCGQAEVLNFNANATAKDGKTYTLDGVVEGVVDGEEGKLVIDLDATVNDKAIDGTLKVALTSDAQTENVSVKVGATIESAPDFVEAPAAVQQARQAALNEYNAYN